MAVAHYAWYFETDSPEYALAGRHMLERYLRDHCEEQDLYAAALIFGELVSNVIKHAPGGGVRVWLEPQGDRYALCINDAGSGFDARAIPQKPTLYAESGRGLYIVERISERISFGRDTNGFLVRAVLPVTRRRQQQLQNPR